MRNLKRALSLTLASVMLLGMMVVGTSAASFPDVTAEDNVEAIEVLAAVSVLQGYDDGQYHADTPVTRNQMATIICRMMGWRDGDFAGLNPFPDVPDWAANYVAACVANGIINGRDDGRFHGDDTVTATEAASMMLRALGYTRMPVGADWARAVAQQASKISLFDGLDVGAYTAMSRGDVAQLALNTMESAMVEVEDNTLDINAGNGVSISGGQINYVVITSGKDYAKAISRAESSGHSLSGVTGYIVELGEQVFNGDLKKSDSSDKFGAPSSRWTYKSREVGTYAKGNDLSYIKEVKIKDIYKDLGLSGTVAKENVIFTIDGTGEGTASSGIQTNGNSPKYLYNVTLTDNDASGQDGAEKIGGKGSVTNVYYKHVPATAAVGASPAVAAHDEVTITVTNYYLAQATEDYDSANKELDIDLKSNDATLSSYTLKLEDFPVISGVKENDYLVLTIAGNEAQTAALAEVVNNVTVSSARSGDYVYAGQKYEYNDVAKADTGALGQDFMDTAANYKLNDTEYNLYLDPKGYVLGVEAANGETNVGDYLFITDYENLRLEHIGEAVFSDGTKKTITVTKLEGNSTFSWGSGNINKFYSFRTNSDGNYELEVVESTSNSNKNAWQSSATGYLDDQAKPIRDGVNGGTGTASGANYSANDNTVFVAKDKAFTGVKNAPETKNSSTIYFMLDKNDRLVFVYTAEKGSNSAKAEDLVYILNNKPAVTKDGNDTFYLYTAIVNGEKVTDFAANDNARKPGLYEISSYTDGRADLPADPIYTGLGDYSDLADYLDDVSSAADYKNGTLTLGSNSYLLAKSAKIFSIDGNTVKPVAPNGVKNAVTVDNFKYAYVVETSSTDSDLSYVYLSKKATDAPAPTSEDIAYDTATITTAIGNAFTGGADIVNITGGALTLDAAYTVPAGKTLHVVTGGIATDSSGSKNLTVAGTLTVDAGGITGTGSVNVTGSADITGDVAAALTVNAAAPKDTGNDVKVTGNVTGVVTATKGKVQITGNATENTTGMTVGADATVIVGGTITKVATTAGSLTAGAITTLADATKGTITISDDASDIDTITDITASGGAVVIDGKVADITDITAANDVTFNKAISGTVTDISDAAGTVTFKSTVNKVSDINSTHAVNFEGAVEIVAITGTPTVGVKAVVTLKPTAAATLGAATFNIAAAGELKLDVTTEDIDIGAATFTGADGAKITVAGTGTKHVTVGADQLYQNGGSTAETDDSQLTDGTYTYATDKFVKGA